jgi:hypothetical protein
MGKRFRFIAFLAALSAVSGYLMSQMSWIGRVGINLMHQEYKFLKVWWQGGAAVFLAMLVLFLLHAIIQRSLPRIVANIFHILLMLAAIGAFCLTYQDFDGDFTHHILRQRFHIGAYLPWLGWVCIGLFFLTEKQKPALAKGADNMGPATV